LSYFDHPGIYTLVCCGKDSAALLSTLSPAFLSTPKNIFAWPYNTVSVALALMIVNHLEHTAYSLYFHEHTQSGFDRDKDIQPASTQACHLQQLPLILKNTFGNYHFPSDTSDLVAAFNI
jgi:hypothetical protein